MDTAPVNKTGKAIQNFDRDKIVINTKFGHTVRIQILVPIILENR
jgi:aryl-alcohol dehydrogenase-like predicted oxidoreductase